MKKDILFEYILEFVPHTFKKIFKGMKETELFTKHQIRVLYEFKQDSGKPMKYYCEKLLISKPNMSSLVSKLIDEGLLTRETDLNDRRITNIFITEKGINVLKEHRQLLKDFVFEKFEKLSEEDIDKLIISFETMKEIFRKID